ncbi:hypothetical protein [Actinokineospora sp. UTMC 2448]|uniref:hypothetical protein n=1 Tax=Actinokineospora sp. UTMC 2448 TaxID=2268449 RepID=UPI002164482C|nr:hypothetical protein [Actinokineospora sp. UTMC 2448]UVS80994.1 hypothetical protein Actkin_04746 [Actinokineospora sp. UTMC 2448]
MDAEIIEALPDDVQAWLDVRDAYRRRAGGMEFLVTDLGRWPLGAPVRVAFLGGDTALHRQIAAATEQITDACGITLDFGWDEGSGQYRRWTEQDTEHAAEIRVGFDLPGYFSLVGADSADPGVGPAVGRVGGRAHQRSLNLGGFTERLPEKWAGTVRHEFLHALGFHHAHQNMRGECEGDFRWEDDPGYVPTQNADGVFVADPAGNRPGIYTFLAGAPNFWPRAKVDVNLRTGNPYDVVAGPFDAKSVMLYSFPALFYRTESSPCRPTGNGVDLSEEDKRGLRLLYPSVAVGAP